MQLNLMRTFSASDNSEIDFELKRSCSPPLGNCADILNLEENSKPHLLRDVCTLCSGALVSNSLLHMLLLQTKEKNQNESLSYRKKTLNHLIIQISYVVCKLDA